MSYKIEVAGSLEQAFSLLRQRKFDIVLLDLGLPDSSGISTLAKTHQAFPELPIVVVTGLADQEKEAEMLRMGVQDYLLKSKLSAENIGNAIQHALERFKFVSNIKAERDLVTGLPNRLALEKALKHSIARAEKQNYLLALLFLDLDNFKAVIALP